MAVEDRYGSTPRRTKPARRRRRSPTRRSNLASAAVAVLIALSVVASATACSSATDATSTTVTSAASAPGSTPAQGGQSGRTPPSGGFPGMRGSTTTTDNTTSTTAPAAASTTEQTTTTTLAEGSYGDGTYLAGTDIESGLYKGSVTGDAAHWEISRDANGERFVAGGDPIGQFYFKVISGRYLRLSGVVVTKASTTATDPLLASGITDGTYRVGYDIAAGWYKGTVNERMGYWEVSSDANAQYLVASDYASGPFSIELESGQYITLRGVTIGQ